MKTIDRPQPNKVLLKVTVQKNPWPIHLMTSPESTVEDLIKATVTAYVKESCRSTLQDTDPRSFELHFSQFSLESLNREEKLMNLGSRNFFLCFNSSEVASSGGECSDSVEKESLRFLLPLPRFMSVDLRP